VDRWKTRLEASSRANEAGMQRVLMQAESCHSAACCRLQVARCRLLVAGCWLLVVQWHAGNLNAKSEAVNKNYATASPLQSPLNPQGI